MWLNSDFDDLLRLFNAYKVRYLVIGGYAVIRYTEPRYTKDLDLWIATDAQNAHSVFGALREFGAPLAGLTEADFSEDGFFYQIGVPPLRVDIMMGIPGVEFDAAWPQREEVDFEGLRIAFVSRQDLIAAKLASGRPQDLIDVDALSKDNPY